MARLPEQAPVERLADLRVTGDGTDAEAPLLGGADQLEGARLVDGMPVEGARLIDHAGAGLDSRPAEVGVLAGCLPVRLVEAFKPFQESARVGDVAGLEPRARSGGVLGA